MVKVRYLGVHNPRAELEKMRPTRDLAIRLMQQCRPSGADYLALLAISQAILQAARHFVPEEPHLFSAAPGVSFGETRKD